MLELTNSTPTVVVPVPEVLRKVPVLVIQPTGSLSEKNGRIPLSSSEFAVKVPALVIVVPLAISMNPLIQFQRGAGFDRQGPVRSVGAEVDEVGIGRVHRRGRAGLDRGGAGAVHGSAGPRQGAA